MDQAAIATDIADVMRICQRAIAGVNVLTKVFITLRTIGTLVETFAVTMCVVKQLLITSTFFIS